MNKSAKGMVLVWRITDDLPNFPTIRYIITYCAKIIEMWCQLMQPIRFNLWGNAGMATELKNQPIKTHHRDIPHVHRGGLHHLVVDHPRSHEIT